MQELERCGVEAVGISEYSVKKCMKWWEDHKLPIHSFLLIRHGKLALEKYYAPYDREKLHRFFSITKSINSLAVGCLEEEGKLRLSDPIVRYFPEYLQERSSQWLEETTIRDMLCMASCHSTTTYKKDPTENWVESFFHVEADRKPGGIFCYDTSASHVLCALVGKLAGMPMLDYLKDRCLNELGFSDRTYMLKDPFGFEQGGTGLMVRPIDLAKLGLLLLNGGRWQEKQLLPARYLHEAVSAQIATCAKAKTVDQAQGYGYQFWRVRNNGYAAWGKGGQWLICLPDQDMVCVTTADTEGLEAGSQMIIDGIFDEILQSLDQEVKPEKEVAWKPLERLRTVLEDYGGQKVSACADRISGQNWIITDDFWIREMQIVFDKSGEWGHWIYVDSQGTHKIRFGFDTLEEGMIDGYAQSYAASGVWFSEDTFYLEIQILDEEPCRIKLQASFSENECSIYLENTGEMCFTEFCGWHCGQMAADARYEI